MKYIVSFLLVVLAFSSFMALSMDCCPKAKPPTMPVQYCQQVKRIENYPTAKPVPYQPPAKPVQYLPPARPVQPPIAAVYETPDNPAETEDEENEEPEDYEQPEDYSEPLPYSDNIIVQEIMNTFGHEWKTALLIKIETARATSGFFRSTTATVGAIRKGTIGKTISLWRRKLGTATAGRRGRSTTADNLDNLCRRIYGLVSNELVYRRRSYLSSFIGLGRGCLVRNKQRLFCRSRTAAVSGITDELVGLF
jgi:hypothetical protein